MVERKENKRKNRNVTKNQEQRYVTVEVLTEDACNLMYSDVNSCVCVSESSQERKQKVYRSDSSLKHV